MMPDSTGHYTFDNVCGGMYDFECELTGFIKKTDTVCVTSVQHTFYLSPDPTSLREVVVTGQLQYAAPLISQSISIIEGKALEATRGTTLGEALQTVPGVYVLQTGPSIFKPVIHGMHSNRVLILNNGVRLEGQQWGSEHAPEIDPFVATRLSVIKGPASIRYGSDAMAGVILVDPAAMPTKPGISGEVNLVGASNNRMGVTSGIVQGAFGKKIKRTQLAATGHFAKGGQFKNSWLLP